MKKDETENRLFFRYQKIDECTKDNLKKNMLYFNDPENFNDPFDCKIDITHEGTKKDWYNFVSKYSIEPTIIDQWIRAGRLKLKRNMRENIYTVDGAKTANELWMKNLKKSYNRICCFSATKLNILMWSHYAENHQGICLCFKTHAKGDGHFLTLNSKLHILFPVSYINQIPDKVNMLDGGQSPEVMKFYLTKYTDWDYETEYRIPIPENEFEQDYTKEYRKEDLEGIIFGLNAKSDKIKEICEIIDTHYLQQGINVNLYSTHKIPGEFAIGVKKIHSIGKYLKKRS